jgi:hypothetical protein
MQRPHWTPEALSLLEPLRVEIELCQQQQRVGTIAKRYRGLTAVLPFAGRDRDPINKPSGGRGRPDAVVNVLEVYDQYYFGLLKLRERLHHTLRGYNHWVDNRQPEPPEWLDIIVANERAESRPAGTLDWTQWEKPGRMRRITAVFEQARAATPTRGRCWIPYALNGKRHATAVAAKRSLWRTAFDAATHAFLTPRFADFHALLLSATITGAIEDAIGMQVMAQRAPYAKRFAAPHSIWHALPLRIRIELAAEHHRCDPDAYNPFELTEEEKNTRIAIAPRINLRKDTP